MAHPQLRFITLLFGVVACAPLTPPDPQTGHVPVSRDLRAQMQRMRNLIYERELTDEQMLYRRKRMAERIARGTRALATELQAEDVDGHFVPFVRQLRDDAEQVTADAIGNGTQTSNEAVRSIERTCDACHQAHQRGWQ